MFLKNLDLESDRAWVLMLTLLLISYLTVETILIALRLSFHILKRG